MKKICIYAFTLLISSCSPSQKIKDTKEIQDLIVQVLTWADSEDSIDLLPVLTDIKDSIYIGFDLEKHKKNIIKLEATGFFTSEFIDNYNNIILTIDKGIRNGDYDQWLVGDLPSFIFANDANPWCMCQGTTVDVENGVDVTNIDYSSGEITWKLKSGSDWGNFKIRVSKENEKWMIEYLQGFDYIESTRKDGQL